MELLTEYWGSGEGSLSSCGYVAVVGTICVFPAAVVTALLVAIVTTGSVSSVGTNKGRRRPLLQAA